MSQPGRGGVILGLTRLYERVPLERIGVLIGKDGAVKKEIEDRTGTKLSVDSTTGSVVIEPARPTTNADDVLRARDVVRAIALGFSPDRAFRLLDEDQVLVVIDLKEYVGDKPNHIERIIGRIIGEEGKTRRIVEEVTGTYVSVHGTTVAIIGDYESSDIAKNAVELLINGKPHAVVYRYLEDRMRALKRRRAFDLWLKP
ncbi:MAG: KH domain-containing protein [Desulfurococcaceae archaeon]